MVTVFTRGNIVKKMLLWLSLGGALVAGEFYAAGHEIEDLQVSIHRETFAGTVFVYREDIAMGSRKESWTVNGRVVTEKEYENLIVEAEKELRRQERQAEQARRRAMQEASLATTLELYKKILKVTIDTVEGALDRCNDARLAPFLQFGVKGELSKSDFEALQGQLEAARALLNSKDDDVVSSMRAAIAQLESMPDRLNGLIQVSMGHATKHCNDTKMLKELLGLVPLG